MIPIISTLMTEHIYSITAEKSVQEGAEEMASENIGSLLVEQKGKYIGMITEVDIIRKVVAKKREPSSVTISEVMAAPIVTIGHDQTIIEAHDLMEEQQIRHLAVTRYGEIIGIVSVRDFLHPIFIEKGSEDLVQKASGF
ncbi:MAG: cyclic nucleotide-binding/CBS domain-containing protein [Nitrospiria bacterium]